jgi:hypothetical protein
LSVAILAEHDIGDQHPLGVEHDQGVARQAPGPGEAKRLDPMLGSRQVTPVEDPDAITLQPRGVAATQLVDDCPEGFARVLDQGGAGGGLDAIDLVVDRLPGDTQKGGHLLEGRVDRRSDAADDEAHEVDDVGEKEVSGVLPLRVPLEQQIDRGR